MFFMKRPLCTCLDLLRPSVQVTVNDKQAQHTEDWSYSMPVQDECDTSQSDTTTDTVPNRYPV